MADFPICSIEECGNEVYCRGLCQRHYSKAYRTFYRCPVPGCESQIWLGGYCKRHYRNWQKFGDVHRDPGPTPIQLFIAKAAQCCDTECLIWPFAMPKGNYAKVHIRVSGKLIIAARYVCEQAHGVPPTSKHEAAHSCGKGNIGCLNGSHLRWATKSENQSDRIVHGTDTRGEKSRNTILVRDDVINIRAALQIGEPEYAVATKFSVSRSTIANIKHRKTWAWLS